MPLVPTIVVLAATAVMVWLGFWQLDRLEEKEALIASYRSAIAQPPLTRFPALTPEQNLFRRTTIDCEGVSDWQAIAGRNADDQPGYVHVASCNAEGAFAFDAPGWAEIVIGWSRDPRPPQWNGGVVSGMIAPGGGNGWRLVADPPQAGLQANATPDPNDLPNNHLAYAGQWFFFALAALVIYGLALRRRWLEKA